MLDDKRVIVVIPAYNEDNTVANLIQNIPSFVDTVLVIDDGSTDRTREKAESAGARVISHASNLGLGAVFQTARWSALELNADIMVFIDGDGQFDPRDIGKLAAPVAQQRADLVTASRFIDKAMVPDMPTAKYWGNRLMSRLISHVVGHRFYDVSCGFRAYSREALLRLNLFGKFTYTQETFIDLAAKGLKILEVPVPVKGRREFGKSRISGNLFRYGYRTLRIILEAYRDYRPVALFLTAAAVLMAIGLVFGGGLLVHYLLTGGLSPHKWAGFVAMGFWTTALLIGLAGFILGILARLRMNQEETLYLLRSQMLGGPKRGRLGSVAQQTRPAAKPGDAE